MPATTLHAQLTTPIAADQIIDGDGASSPETQAATVALFHAIGHHHVAGVERALAQGARPNARRTAPTIGARPVGWLTTPLDIALWLTTHDANDAPRATPNRASQPPKDLCATLIAGGATTTNPPTMFFKNSGWETHPACKALEHHAMDRLVRGEHRPSMTKAARTDPALYLQHFRSVVVASPVRNPQSWLHRAIVRERWDAVKAWVDQGLVLNFPGSDNACELLVMGHMDEPGPREEQLMLDGLDLLRPGLLAETDAAYRAEVVGTVRALAFFEDDPSTAPRRARLAQWLEQVIVERPTHLGLTGDEVAGDLEPGMRRLLQGFEARALQRATRATIDDHPATPVVSRPRL